jgi:hypothetical protein
MSYCIIHKINTKEYKSLVQIKVILFCPVGPNLTWTGPGRVCRGEFKVNIPNGHGRGLRLRYLMIKMRSDTWLQIWPWRRRSEGGYCGDVGGQGVGSPLEWPASDACAIAASPPLPTEALDPAQAELDLVRASANQQPSHGHAEQHPQSGRSRSAQTRRPLTAGVACGAASATLRYLQQLDLRDLPQARRGEDPAQARERKGGGLSLPIGDLRMKHAEPALPSSWGCPLAPPLKPHMAAPSRWRGRRSPKVAGMWPPWERCRAGRDHQHQWRKAVQWFATPLRLGRPRRRRSPRAARSRIWWRLLAKAWFWETFWQDP